MKKFIIALPLFFMCWASNAAVLELTIESNISGVFWPINGEEAPFNVGESVTVAITYDTTSPNFSEGASLASYNFVSMISTWGNYTFTSSGSPFGPATQISSGIYVRDSDTGTDRLSILDQSVLTGGGLVGDDILGLAIDGLAIDFLDSDGDALGSDSLPTSLDVALFDSIDGRLNFSNNMVNGFVNMSGTDVSVRIVPIPAAAWLLLSGCLGLLGVRRVPKSP